MVRSLKNMSKSERYGWVIEGDRGVAEDVPIDLIKVDLSYQRNEVSKTNTLAIAKNFSWVAFNRIVLMRRANGDLYVADGYQRLCGARRKGDIHVVPCEIFKSNGPAHEAEAFYALNVRRHNVSVFAKFRARVAAGGQPEVDINNWLTSVGLHLTTNGKAENGLCFPDRVLRHWKLNPEITKAAILTERALVEPESLSGLLHSGVWWLIYKGVDVAAHVERLNQLGGKAFVKRYINERAVLTGKSPHSHKVSGEGLLMAINYRLRKKVYIPDNAPVSEDLDGT
jgi:hypothetical protein